MSEDATVQRRRDSQHKLKKTVYFTPEGFETIKAYAKEQGVTISSATETLALIGLDQDIAKILLPAVASIITTQMNQAQNRFAKLLASSAIEAGTARQMTQHLYWMQLLRELDETMLENDNEVPTKEEFASRFSVAPKSAEGKVVMDMYHKMQRRSRYRSVKTLRQPIKEWGELADELLALPDPEASTE